VDPEYYYACLRNAFDHVEKETGLKVVIAACPRADYSNTPNPFGEREIVFYQTGRLIGESKLVLAHRSTAIGFAIMFRRPVMLIALEDAMNHINHQIPMTAYAEALGRQVQLIDENENMLLDCSLEFDQDTYDTFMSNYVKTHNSPNAAMWEIVMDEISVH